MKIRIRGNTPMERLTNLMRGVLAVPKSEVERADKKQSAKTPRRKAATA
jgi:hypothetical protein